MDWLLYAVALPVALLLLAFAGCAYYWASKHGQTTALWETLRSWWASEPPPVIEEDLLVRPSSANRPSPQS